MRVILPLIISILLFSCSKTSDLIVTTPPPVVITPVNPPAPLSYFRMSLNGQSVSFSSVFKQRSLASKIFNVTAENDSLKVELKMNAVTQTGNSTGLILIGSYSWKLYRKNAEGGSFLYPTTEQRLGIFNNNPMTDPLVTGYFSFKTSIPGETGINVISGGEFCLVF